MGRTGILGGTFDPIHLAHLAMGRRALEEQQLDRVLFMPSKIPPHKLDRQISPENIRRDMVQLAIEGEEGFFFSDFELRRQEVTYTARTLSLLKREQPREEFYFILGGDSLFYFDKWKQPEVILRHAVILAFARGGMGEGQMEMQAKYLTGRFGGEIRIIYMPCIDISSSEIRDRLSRGESVRDLVPAPVYDYILKTGCYDIGGKRHFAPG